MTVRCFSPPGWIDVDEKLTEQQQRDEVHKYCGVFKFEFAGVSVMFAGDSDLNCWKRIEGYYEHVDDENDMSVIESTVLHASHHGSYTFFKDAKDDEPWLGGLEAIDPETVVVSVGAENKYDHRDEEAMESYRTHVGASNTLDTEHVGTIVLEVEPGPGVGAFCPTTAASKVPSVGTTTLTRSSTKAAVAAAPVVPRRHIARASLLVLGARASPR